MLFSGNSAPTIVAWSLVGLLINVLIKPQYSSKYNVKEDSVVGSEPCCQKRGGSWRARSLKTCQGVVKTQDIFCSLWGKSTTQTDRQMYASRHPVTCWHTKATQR